jgi:GrpB-like predicted nucleotidyltransferase (UPF0157 family)
MKKLSEMTLEELWELFPITLEDYNPLWKDYYKTEEKHLLSCLKQFNPTRIEHIGSTAIPNIKAKAIIDILIEVKHEDFYIFKELIINCGYLLMRETKERMSFNKGYTEKGYAKKVFHLHLRKEHDHDEIYFRDYLINHIDKAKSYEALKMKLAKQYKHNRDEYTNQKTNFVKEITNKAIIEHKLFILSQIASAFNKNNITWNLGASCMLYLRGIVEEFSDIDLFVSKNDISLAKSILDHYGVIQPNTKSDSYKTDFFYEYTIEEVDIDLISGFKILKDHKLYDLSFDDHERFETIKVNNELIYLASLDQWEYFYQIMDRKVKVDLLKKHKNGSDR